VNKFFRNNKILKTKNLYANYERKTIDKKLGNENHAQKVVENSWKKGGKVQKNL
jgi:hypothetical protein